jgi:AcrR family transcriptional regulator
MGMEKKSTHDKILEVTLKLFNEYGAHSITTNHIAKAMNISPGNLYYHYKNKQAIIRGIFLLITQRFYEIWETADMKPENAASFCTVFENIADLYYEYRFFYLEMPSLLAQDDELKKMYAENMRSKHLLIEKTICTLIDAGIMHKPDSAREMKSWIENGWIISDFYLSYLFSADIPITKESIREGTRNFFYFVKPSLTEKGLTLAKPFF